MKQIILGTILALFFALSVPVLALETESLFIKSGGKSHQFKVEIATTELDRSQGLMFRDSLPEDGGMLFLFNESAERSFWMRNTLIPLDIIFIKPDGTIHSIHAMAKPHDETVISSNGAVNAALEIPGGRAEKLGLKPGDKVLHVFFRNTLAP